MAHSPVNGHGPPPPRCSFAPKVPGNHRNVPRMPPRQPIRQVLGCLQHCTRRARQMPWRRSAFKSIAYDTPYRIVSTRDASIETSNSWRKFAPHLIRSLPPQVDTCRLLTPCFRFYSIWRNTKKGNSGTRTGASVNRTP